MAEAASSFSNPTGAARGIFASAAQKKETPIKGSWEWVYQPSYWDPVEIKQFYENLSKEDPQLTEIAFVGEFEARVEQFLYAKTGQPLKKIPADTPIGQQNLKITFSNDKRGISLPSFISNIAPLRKNVDPSDPKVRAGEPVNPIPGFDIRYACIAPVQSEAGFCTVLLSVWIKPPSDWESPLFKAEKAVNDRYKVFTFERNEDWAISHLYLSMKSAEAAWLFVNAVARLVYESNSKMEWRVNRIRPFLAGYLQITETTVQIRDKIDLERLETDGYWLEDADRDPEHLLDLSNDAKARLESDARMESPSGIKTGPTIYKTATEATLVAKERYVLLDEEHFGLYEGPFCEHGLYELRFFQNPTEPNVTVDNMYYCKKTGQLELNQDDMMLIIKPADKDPECFEKLLDIIRGRKKIVGKPKKIFSDNKEYKNYHEAMALELTNLDQIEEFQQKLLERLNEQNKAFEESQARKGKRKGKESLPPELRELLEEQERQGPPLPPGAKNWIIHLLTGCHQAELPDDENVADHWITSVQPALTNMIGSNIEACNLPGFDGATGDELLKKTLLAIRTNLREIKIKHAIAKLQALRDKFANDLLLAVKDVSKYELLERIYFLPDY